MAWFWQEKSEAETARDRQKKREMIERQEAHRRAEAAKDPYRACCRIESF